LVVGYLCIIVEIETGRSGKEERKIEIEGLNSQRVGGNLG
jgi:hypothetical protein